MGLWAFKSKGSEPPSNLDAKLPLQARETVAELQHEAGVTTVPEPNRCSDKTLARGATVGLSRNLHKTLALAT